MRRKSRREESGQLLASGLACCAECACWHRGAERGRATPHSPKLGKNDQNSSTSFHLLRLHRRQQVKPGQTFWRARAWALADMCVLSKVASAGFHLVANQAFARMTAWPCVQSMTVIGPPGGGGALGVPRRSRGRGRRAVSVAARQWAPRRAGRIAWPARPACLRLVSRTAPPRPKRGPPTDRESDAASRARTPRGLPRTPGGRDRVADEGPGVETGAGREDKESEGESETIPRRRPRFRGD